MFFFRKKNKSKNTKQCIAFVGPYNITCGISTYNEELLKHLSKHIEFKIFADYADDCKSERIAGDPDYVVRCWDRSEYPKKKLINAISEYNPSLVHICHEYGFWSKAYYFTNLVSILKSKGLKVITTLHSVYEHKDKVVSENVSDHLIVHTMAAKNCLARKGISEDKIDVIPHGAEVGKKPLNSLWNTWGIEHTIFQPGFLFYYKGHLKMIEVVKNLKAKYPDIHYIIQGSENKNTQSEHDALYNDLLAKIKEYGLEDNVTINRGFVDKEVLMSYIRTTKVCVLPYSPHPDHDVYATSGIARMVLSTTTPLIVSNAHLFDDLEGVVPRASSIEEFSDCIEKVFENKDDNQLEARIKLLDAVNWDTVAQSTYNLYQKLILK
jgi:glycosyltransferase involved in cell wall biosynthesis